MAGRAAGDIASTISDGGGVADGQVSTASIVVDAVTETNAAVVSADIALPDATDVDVFSLTVTKDVPESLIRVDAVVIMQSSDDLRGTFTFYQTSNSDQQVYPIFMNSPGGTLKMPVSLFALFPGLPAGTVTFKLKFRRNGGASAVSALAGSLFSVREEKR